jgi:peptidoglycan/LPS O-acetylase OafA/YrhL
MAPYGTWLSALFAHGYLGVQLFFMVSGFVIALTLERCRSPGEFAVKRFARLWPTMLLASSITFAYLSTVSAPFGADALNFAPSLSFIDPAIFNWVSGSTRFSWMDGAYWSLGVEVKFYILVSAVYFMARDFKPAMVTVAVLISVVSGAVSILGIDPLRLAMQSVFISGHLPWFVIGIGGYCLFTGDRRYAALFVAVGLVSLLGNAAVKRDAVLAVSAVLFSVLFFAALTQPSVARVLSWRPAALIGAASYSFYLLHQLLGISLIDNISHGLHLQGGFAALVPIVVIAMLALLSITIYRFYEAPINLFLVSTLKRRQAAARPVPTGTNA